jgi:predicted flap endonuclease-1-like 5' DNA nuclease
MKRFTRICGAVAGIAAVVVVALWLLKDRIAGPAPAPVEPADAPRFRVPPPAPAPPADDLTAIKGIGPVYSARLAEAGIVGYAALTAADAAELAGKIDVAESQIEDWKAQASDLADS